MHLNNKPKKSVHQSLIYMSSLSIPWQTILYSGKCIGICVICVSYKYFPAYLQALIESCYPLHYGNYDMINPLLFSISPQFAHLIFHLLCMAIKLFSIHAWILRLIEKDLPSVWVTAQSAYKHWFPPDQTYPITSSVYSMEHLYTSSWGTMPSWKEFQSPTGKSPNREDMASTFLRYAQLLRSLFFNASSLLTFRPTMD